MLPKKRRISREEFKITSQAKRYNSPHLLLSVVSGSKLKESKFSFSVSKKILKSAASRNKFRRQGYSVIGKLLSKIKSGYFCFFSLKKSDQNLNFKEIEKEIIGLLETASVLL